MQPAVKERVFIGLGSNLEDRADRIGRALDWLRDHPEMDFVAATGCIETEPWGVTDQPPFLNAVAEIRTTMDPETLLAEIQRAEIVLGRKKDGREHWGPREIDLDILLFGERIIETPTLVVPHPQLTKRPFVLAQLIELEPEIVHPEKRIKLKRFFDQLSDSIDADTFHIR